MDISLLLSSSTPSKSSTTPQCSSSSKSQDHSYVSNASTTVTAHHNIPTSTAFVAPSPVATLNTPDPVSYSYSQSQISKTVSENLTTDRPTQNQLQIIHQQINQYQAPHSSLPPIIHLPGSATTDDQNMIRVNAGLYHPTSDVTLPSIARLTQPPDHSKSNDKQFRSTIPSLLSPDIANTSNPTSSNDNLMMSRGELSDTAKTTEQVAAVTGILKPFVCTYEGCGARFGQKGSLTRHVRSRHEKLRPHTCEICQKSFSALWTLRVHQRNVHLKAKPHKCHLCDKSFGELFNKSKHIAIVHQGKRPFSCPICSRAFGYKGDMRKHVLELHQQPGRPFQCIIPSCGVKFARKRYLRRHENLSHKGHPLLVERDRREQEQERRLEQELERQGTEQDAQFNKDSSQGQLNDTDPVLGMEGVNDTGIDGKIQQVVLN